jgi:hypothetical protein
MRAARVLLATVMTSTFAHADDDASVSCLTSNECAPLRCVAGICRDPFAPPKRRDPNVATDGFKAMFGDGTDYRTPILVADVVASLSVPLLLVAGAATNNLTFGVLALFPTTLTGPIIHLAHGRPVPAVISFLGWAFIPPSAVLAGDFLVTTGGFVNSDTPSIAVFATFATVAAAGMTVLDWWMARAVRLAHKPQDVAFKPNVAPLRGGVLAGISGAW